MNDSSEPENEGSNLPVWITLFSVVACLISGVIWYLTGNSAVAVTCLVFQTVIVSIIIWQACDPFADAAQYIGHELRLPGSVRGATLDAVASSMPELFTGIFFVLLVVVSSDGHHLESAKSDMSGDGFKATIATCAGSAVYNMILIPAICALFISAYRKDRPTIEVESRVITRDGAWFVFMEILLIVFLMQKHITWWMGVVFLISYFVYVLILYLDARQFRKKVILTEQKIADGSTVNDALQALRDEGHHVGRDLERRFQAGHALHGIDGDDPFPRTAGLFFGRSEINLSLAKSWMIILISTVIAATACFWLVEITQETAAKLGIDVFFVAVILAAAASSVPDTFLSIGSAKSGDDDGAVANAFGSNIFDISICISIPLIVACYLNNWEPIVMEQSGEIAGLQVMLAILTVITLGIIWHRLQLTRGKAIVLCGLYLLFIGYAILGSMGFLDWG